jgi:hypothetical protein
MTQEKEGYIVIVRRNVFLPLYGHFTSMRYSSSITPSGEVPKNG